MKSYLEYINEAKGGVNRPFYNACKDKNYGLARQLIDQVDDIDFCLADGRTPLFFAVFGPDPELANMILEKGADVDKRDSNGWTCLMYACKHPQNTTEMVSTLLKYKPETEYALRNTVMSAVYMSVCNPGKEDILKLLIDDGASVEESTDRTTPLQKACEKNRLSYVKMLIEAGADPMSKSYDGWLDTPVNMVIKDNKDKIYQYFVEQDIIEPSKSDYEKGGNNIKKLLQSLNFQLYIIEKLGINYFAEQFADIAHPKVQAKYPDIFGAIKWGLVDLGSK